MRLSDWLLSELEIESVYTRKHLERVPMEQLEFKPHPTSMTLGWLATFLAIIPTWGEYVVTLDSFDAAPEGAKPPERTIARSEEQLLGMFDGNVAKVRSVLQATTDEGLEAGWSLKAGGRIVFTRPRFLVFETYFLNHMIHHRAQLGVYLRLCGVPVPAVYNGSSDEQGGIFIDDSPASVTS